MAVDDQYTVSLLHFDGGLTDESGKVWTPNYGAATSTVQSKFGGSSLQLNGTTQYLTIPSNSDFDFGNGDFTVDWWEYRSDGSNDVTTVSGSVQHCTYFFGYAYNGIVYTYISSDGSTWDIAPAKSMGSVILNTWTHYAVCRQGSNFYTFQNGVLISTWSSTKSIKTSTESFSIGYNNHFYKGYIDELRVSKGIARWTSNFTPPTAPYSPGVSVNPPTNLTATAGDSQITLSWNAVTGATGYNVKRSTTAGGPYTTIAINVTGTSYVDNTVTNGTTYYYVVTALDANGNESANSNEASATPRAISKALLRVTMIDSSEREYRLSTSECDGFINWYNSHKSTDTMSYAINDSVDHSKEYLSFDKVISFKVIPIME